MGLLQGVTEFLPISSSGHLAICRHLLGVDFSDAPLLLDTILHFGTLLAVCFVFFSDLRGMAVQFVRSLRGQGLRTEWRLKPELRLIGWILLATIPAVVIGFSLLDIFEQAFGSLRAVGVSLLITALLLFLSRLAGKGKTDADEMKWWQALVVGVSQAAAITPGISRSGTTIVVGLFAGLDRETAGRFSFLIAIPAICGAVVLQAVKIDVVPEGFVLAALAGFVTATISGYFSLKLLLRFVKAGQLHWFGFYCMLVGIWALVSS